MTLQIMVPKSMEYEEPFVRNAGEPPIEILRPQNETNSSRNALWIAFRFINRKFGLVFKLGAVTTFLATLSVFLLGIHIYSVISGLQVLVLVLLGMLPSLGIMYRYYWTSFKRTISVNRIGTFFLLGACGILPIFHAEKLMEGFFGDTGSHYLNKLVEAFFVVALCEELFKLILAMVVPVEQTKQEPLTVMLMSLSGAVGLATAENCAYVLKAWTFNGLESGLVTAVGRALLPVPFHAATGILIGSDIARRKFSVGRQKSLLRTLAAPIILHGTYDFFAFCATDTRFTESVKDATGGWWVPPLMSAALTFCVAFAVWTASRQYEDIQRGTLSSKYTFSQFSL